MRCGTIGSCQSAAISEIVKALLVASLTRVSGAITSVQTFTFTLVTSTTKSCCCSVNIYLVCSIIPPLSPPPQEAVLQPLSVSVRLCFRTCSHQLRNETKRSAQLDENVARFTSNKFDRFELERSKAQRHNAA